MYCYMDNSMLKYKLTHIYISYLIKHKMSTFYEVRNGVNSSKILSRLPKYHMLPRQDYWRSNLNIQKLLQTSKVQHYH